MPNYRRYFGEFVRARRLMLVPEQFGFPHDTKRRTAGLRREEVASLAGISREYYIRIEQGRNHRVSDQVLASLSRALQLDDDGRAYLYRLAMPSPALARRPRQVSAASLRLLTQLSNTPAFLFDNNQDILVVNEIASSLAPDHYAPTNNLVTMLFSTDSAERSHDLWRATARASLAALRFHGDPDDPRMQEIVGALSVRDHQFREMWAEHTARRFTDGVTPHFVHNFGWVDMPWQILAIPDDQFLSVHLAPPGTPAAAVFRELSSSSRVGDQSGFLDPVAVVA